MDNGGVQNLIDEGDRLLFDDQLEAAERKYQEALKIDPSSAEALYSIGAIATRRGQFPIALKWAERAIAADSSYKQGYALLGNVLLGLERYEEALDALEAALSGEADEMILAQMGLCCEAMGRWADAEAHLRLALEKDMTYTTRFSYVALYSHEPFWADLHHSLARVLQQQNKLDEARLHYHLTKRIDPTTRLNPMYLEIMSEADLENHPAELQERMKPSTDSPPEDILGYLLEFEDYAELQQACQEFASEELLSILVAVINATQEQGNLYLSAQLRVVGDTLYGENYFETFEALRTPSWKRLFELAELVLSEEIEEADGLRFTDRLDFNWDSVSLLLALVRRFIEIAPSSGLVLALLTSEVLSRSPDGRDAGMGKRLVGLAYFGSRDLSNALRAYEEAFAAFEEAHAYADALQTLLDMGGVHIKHEDYQTAEMILNQYLMLAKEEGYEENLVWGYYNRAVIHFKAGRVAEGYEDGLTAVAEMRLHGDVPELHANLISLLHQAAELTDQSVPDDVLSELMARTVTEDSDIQNLFSRAYEAEDDGRPEEAIRLFEQASEQALEMGDRKVLIHALSEIGLLQAQEGRLEESADTLKEALHYAEPLKAEVDIWPILINLVYVAESLEDGEEAVEYAETALKEARHQGSAEREKQTLEVLSRLLIDVDPQLAIEHFGRSLELPSRKDEELPDAWVAGMNALSQQNYKSGIEALTRLLHQTDEEAIELAPRALANIGIAHIHMGNIEQGLAAWEEATTLWVERKESDHALEMLGRIAQLQQQTGEDYQETVDRIFRLWTGLTTSSGLRRSVGAQLAEDLTALDEFWLAEEIAKEVIEIATNPDWQDNTDEMVGRRTLGRIYRQTGRYKQALSEYEIALALARRLKDEVAEGEILGWMGITYRFLGRLEDAIEAYQSAVDVGLPSSSSRWVATQQMNLAVTLFLLGRTDEGKDVTLQAFYTFQENQEVELAIRCLLSLFEYLGWDGLSDEMREQLDHYVAATSLSRDPFIAGRTMAYLAYQHAEMDDFEEAGSLMEQAIHLYRALNDKANEAWALLTRARLLATIKPEQAQVDAEKALAIVDNVTRIDLQSIETEEFLLHLALKRNDTRAVERTLENLFPRWIAWRRQLKHDRDRIQFADRVRNTTQECAAFLLAHGKVGRAFELQEWGRAQALLDLVVVVAGDQSVGKQGQEKSAASERDTAAVANSEQTAELVDLTRAKALLTAFEQPALILTLALVGDQAMATTLRLEADSPTFHPLQLDRAGIEDLLTTFNREMHRFRGQGSLSWRTVGDLLLAPIAEEIRQDDLVILVAEDGLQQLPVHALHFPNGEMLLERAAVVYAPSLTVLESIERSTSLEDQSPAKQLITVGVAFPDEARAISLRFGGLCLSGNNLDKEEIHGLVTDYRILHFACHGVFDQDHYLDSGLVLRVTDEPLRREILSLRDLMSWRLSCDLAVLSACETGRGKPAPSGFLGLGRGFLAAGSRSVLVALWSIDNMATQDFMLSFYANVRQQKEEGTQMNVAEALRRTQLAYAASTPLYDWAGFKLIGWPYMDQMESME